MILVDTSIWIDHLRSGDEPLIDLLNSSQILAHPLVIGELACGNLRKRDEVLRLLNDLPQAVVASHEEILHFIERNKLMGKAVGYLDVHLLASTALTDTALIWDITRAVKRRFDAEGVSIPFPQRDVHLYQASPSSP